MSVLGKRLLAVILGAVIVWGAWAFFASNFLGCTAAGCFSSLTIDTGVIPEEGTTYENEVCLDGECWSGTQTGNMYLPDESGSIRLDAAGVVDVGLAVEGERPSTAEVSIVITADGEEIVRHQDRVEFEEYRPNGRWCDPVCYSGTVVI